MTTESAESATRASSDPSAQASRVREVAFWLLLAVACSPILVDLTLHLRAEPWAAYALCFGVLLLRELIRTPEQRQPLRIGFALIVLGLIIQLLMMRAGWPRLGRPGVALAFFGLALGMGHPRPALALLAFWAIPVPHNLVKLFSPSVEAWWLQIAAALYNALGLQVQLEWVTGTDFIARLQAMNPRLIPVPADTGVPLAALFAGLAWYAGVRAGRSLPQLAARCAGWALLAIPIQILAVTAALGLARSSPEAARLALTHVTWITAVLVFLWHTGRRIR